MAIFITDDNQRVCGNWLGRFNMGGFFDLINNMLFEITVVVSDV